MKRCGAKTRAGTPCKQKAGWGTDHVGDGRCKLHGGGSKGRPIIHGRYSIKHKESLREKQRIFMNDPEAGNLVPELALLRALLEDYLDRFGEDMRMSQQNVSHAQDIIADIGRMVERINRIRNQTALTVAEIRLVQIALKEVVVKYIPEEQRDEFFYDLRRTFAELSGQPIIHASSSGAERTNGGNRTITVASVDNSTGSEMA